MAHTKCCRSVTIFFIICSICIILCPSGENYIGYMYNMSGLKGAKSDRLRNEVLKEIKRLGMEPTYDPICTPELLNISFAKRQYT